MQFIFIYLASIYQAATRCDFSISGMKADCNSLYIIILYYIILYYVILSYYVIYNHSDISQTSDEFEFALSIPQVLQANRLTIRLRYSGIYHKDFIGYSLEIYKNNYFEKKLQIVIYLISPNYEFKNCRAFPS